jgi:hypothetical protein
MVEMLGFTHEVGVVGRQLVYKVGNFSARGIIENCIKVLAEIAKSAVGDIVGKAGLHKELLAFEVNAVALFDEMYKFIEIKLIDACINIEYHSPSPPFSMETMMFYTVDYTIFSFIFQVVLYFLYRSFSMMI